ncbi:chlororespiratory reduction 6 domain-containing protein [Rhodoblastus sp.]|uniref:chlororespiratory reduction 6 domain-containing protein n=1 Tax=Rhodoblastus sp. TaxID=1962975 RepID=UPI003F9BA004
MTLAQFDPLVILITRDEVERGDIDAAISVFKDCLSSVEKIRARFEQLDIVFHGYDDDRREIFEIPEVRKYVGRLDEKFPFWLFFMNKECLGLQAISLCFLPPYLTEQARKTIIPQGLDQLLNNRWWPAMNQVCEAVGFTENEIEKLSDRVVSYFTSGPVNRR